VTFPNLSIGTPGTGYTLVASAAGAGGVASIPFSIFLAPPGAPTAAVASPGSLALNCGIQASHRPRSQVTTSIAGRCPVGCTRGCRQWKYSLSLTQPSPTGNHTSASLFISVKSNEVVAVFRKQARWEVA
jgi:hypothetical protein